MSPSDELLRRIHDYAQRINVALVDQLGYGMHGSVFVAESQAGSDASLSRLAVKVHRREQEYIRERDTYLRLRKLDVTRIRECEVPQLIDFDNRLWIIAMTVVRRPFVLDFAGAYLDSQPDFSEEVMADWRAQKQEEFGRHWPDVQAVLRHLECLGIYMVDVNPGNISFRDE